MKRVKVYRAKNKKQAIDKIAQDVSEIYKSPMYSVTPNYDRWTVDVYDVNNNLVLIFYPTESEKRQVKRYKYRPATTDEILEGNKTLYVKETTTGNTSNMLSKISKIDSIAYEVIL